MVQLTNVHYQIHCTFLCRVLDKMLRLATRDLRMMTILASPSVPYAEARGRYAPRKKLVDKLEVRSSVVTGKPNSQEFVRLITRELRIRFYQPKTIASYRTALQNLLSWFSRQPHQLTRDDVREYLLFLVDADVSASWVAVNLSAIRTAFDKMCGREVTLGLVTPRRPKRLPVVLSKGEVKRLLESAPSLRDKLILGLMYGMGLRVSEVASLRFRDLDFDRKIVFVYQGKGRKDRQVILPTVFLSTLQELAKHSPRDAYLFASGKVGKHISPRTIQRIMKRAVEIAKISKHATPHSLRHSFATHSFESGCDIRDIQKWLGHANLDTTTIYLRVAKPANNERRKTPLDTLLESPPQVARPVGNLRLHFKPEATAGAEGRRCKVTIGVPSATTPTIYLTGIVATEARPGWITLNVPPYEQWEEPMRWLTRSQRERIESPHFFETLQREIPKRFSLQFE